MVGFLGPPTDFLLWPSFDVGIYVPSSYVFTCDGFQRSVFQLDDSEGFSTTPDPMGRGHTVALVLRLMGIHLRSRVSKRSMAEDTTIQLVFHDLHHPLTMRTDQQMSSTHSRFFPFNGMRFVTSYSNIIYKLLFFNFWLGVYPQDAFSKNNAILYTGVNDLEGLTHKMH